jgi:excisionase family DNA binding protein
MADRWDKVNVGAQWIPTINFFSAAHGVDPILSTLLQLLQMAVIIRKRSVPMSTTETRSPDESAMHQARESARIFDGLEDDELEKLEMHIAGRTTVLPPGLAQLVRAALQKYAAGKPLVLVPLEEELTPNEVAEILNVSRPFVRKLIDEGELPARKVGAHYRVRANEVLEFKERNKQARAEALSELAAESQALDLY